MRVTEQIALTDPRFTTPGSSRGLKGVFQQRYLLGLLLKKGITTRYYGSVLGWVWSYIRPTAQFLMYYIVMGVIFDARGGIEKYPVYLFTGIITINLFSEILRNTTSAIIDNKSLVQKIYLPREIFSVAAVGVGFVHFLPQMVILLVVCLFVGWTFSWIQLAALLLALLILAVFTLGLGLFFGALNVAHRDWKNIVDLILMFATWTSPVLYSFSMVKNVAPDWLYHLYMANPVTSAVELMHSTFWAGTTVDAARPDFLWVYVGIGVMLALFTLLGGQTVFRKLEGSFAQNL